MSTPASPTVNYRITFDFDSFIARFPEFRLVPKDRAQAMFNRVQAGILDNTWVSPVKIDSVLEDMFFLLVAHLCTLYPCAPGGAASVGGSTRPPGNMTSATEGSVSTAFTLNMPQGSGTGPWFFQTEYGLEFWTISAPYRSARYFSCGNSGVGFSRSFLASPFPANLPRNMGGL